jgi:hypothetical protein
MLQRSLPRVPATSEPPFAVLRAAGDRSSDIALLILSNPGDHRDHPVRDGG